MLNIPRTSHDVSYAAPVASKKGAVFGNILVYACSIDGKWNHCIKAHIKLGAKKSGLHRAIRMSGRLGRSNAVAALS